MDLRSGLPYFWIRSGLPYLYPKLDADLRCEVLIVGGGITGALCAHACTVAGLDTVVIDARTIGTGSTSASTALLQHEIDVPLHVLAKKVGVERAVRSYRACALAVEQITAQAQQWEEAKVLPRASLQFASKRGHVESLRKEHAMRSMYGFGVEFLEHEGVKERFGFSKPAAILSHVAAEIDPYAYTHALLQDAITHGARVFDRTRSEEYKGKENAFVVRTVEQYTIHAKHLIMATGYESQRQFEAPHVDLLSTYAIASKRMQGDTFWEGDCLIWETAEPYLYLRTTPDGRIIIGGLDEPFRDPARRDKLLARKSLALQKSFHELFPKVPFEMEYQWCGTFGSTKDGLPYIDQDPRTGAWYVLGMGGNGITFSQVGATIVRDAILGRTNLDRDLFRFNR